MWEVHVKIADQRVSSPPTEASLRILKGSTRAGSGLMNLVTAVLAAQFQRSLVILRESNKPTKQPTKQKPLSNASYMRKYMHNYRSLILNDLN